MIAPRTCSCAYMMEWRADPHPYRNGPGGAYFCAHCDRGCEQPACHACTKAGVKR